MYVSRFSNLYFLNSVTFQPFSFFYQIIIRFDEDRIEEISGDMNGTEVSSKDEERSAQGNIKVTTDDDIDFMKEMNQRQDLKR